MITLENSFFSGEFLRDAEGQFKALPQEASRSGDGRRSGHRNRKLRSSVQL